uniref:DNA oxidative demethylase ALKBH2 n=1 Tax=Lygus hesperus TaxID=30085 RepID=A0A0K8T6M6_LYGHE
MKKEEATTKEIITAPPILNGKLIQAEGLDLWYLHQFLTKKQADKLFDTLEDELEYFTGDLAKVKIFGKWRDIPREQVAFGDPGMVYRFSSLSVPALPWPSALKDLRDDVSSVLGQDYNFVLVNRYRNGLDHMGEHRDDEGELDEGAGIVSISLGQVRDFVLRHRDVKFKKRRMDSVKIPLGHGSLLHMRSPTNTFWYHALPPRKKALGVRINLTFRKVIPEKMSKK